MNKTCKTCRWASITFGNVFWCYELCADTRPEKSCPEWEDSINRTDPMTGLPWPQPVEVPERESDDHNTWSNDSLDDDRRNDEDSST